MKKLTKKIVKEEKALQLYGNESCTNWICNPSMSDSHCTNVWC